MKAGPSRARPEPLNRTSLRHSGGAGVQSGSGRAGKWHPRSVRVETVDGPVDVKVPKGAKDGTKLRLRGTGVSHGKAGGRGDQLVEIHIVPPEGADEALAQFMAEWEKTHPQNPRRKGAA